MLRTASAVGVAVVLAVGGVVRAQPAYTIHDLGVIDPGDIASQGNGASAGGVGVGRSVGVSNRAFSWTLGGGLVALPNLPGRAFGVAYGANDSGLVVGDGTTTAFGSGSLPLVWTNGSVSQLPLVSGETIGRARDVNAHGVAVGSNSSGSLEYGVYWDAGAPFPITQTTDNGSRLVVANGINDAGLVMGFGVDPNNAARNVGFVYDTTTGIAFEVGALNGMNGAIAFGISNAGHIVGSSMLNQGSGMPFLWTESGGIVPIPLPAGTSQGSARGVNADGWAVGVASSAFAIPFLFDGAQTYALQDLLPGGTGWDLATNTSSAALGISDTGVIIGTGVLNGDIRAFAMVPVPAPGAMGLLGVAVGCVARRRR
jgi:uncharacterized membrane protein